MMSSFSSPRFFNPLMLWINVALKTNEMLLSAGSVIQMRTTRMANAGFSPDAADMAEFQLMGQEKLAAASESSSAMVAQMQTTQFSLMNRAMKHWVGSGVALFSLATSTNPAQAVGNAKAFGSASARSIATVSQLSSASARIAQRGLKPIQRKVDANARRLTGEQHQNPIAQIHALGQPAAQNTVLIQKTQPPSVDI